MLTIPCSENYVHLCNESDNTLSVCLTVLHVTATNVQHEAGILTLGVCVCVGGGLLRLQWRQGTGWTAHPHRHRPFLGSLVLPFISPVHLIILHQSAIFYKCCPMWNALLVTAVLEWDEVVDNRLVTTVIIVQSCWTSVSFIIHCVWCVQFLLRCCHFCWSQDLHFVFS